jgi:hypothetical protein
MLSAACYMLRDQVEYGDLGADCFHRRDRTRLAINLVKRLRQLGVEVQITTAAA